MFYFRSPLAKTKACTRNMGGVCDKHPDQCSYAHSRKDARCDRYTSVSLLCADACVLVQVPTTRSFRWRVPANENQALSALKRRRVHARSHPVSICAFAG